jgi:hypothetical protein
MAKERVFIVQEAVRYEFKVSPDFTLAQAREVIAESLGIDEELVETDDMEPADRDYIEERRAEAYFLKIGAAHFSVTILHREVWEKELPSEPTDWFEVAEEERGR